MDRGMYLATFKEKNLRNDLIYFVLMNMELDKLLNNIYTNIINFDNIM